MRIQNMKLILTKQELYNIIDESNCRYRPTLLSMIRKFKKFSAKQYEWLLDTVNNITRHDKKYKDISYRFIGFKLEGEE